MGFSGQNYWSGLPFPSPGDLPDPGIKPSSPALQADSLPSEPPGKPRTTVWPNNPTPGHIHREKPSSKRHMYPSIQSNMFAIARTWKQPKCPSIEKWIKQMWSVYTVEYYSVKDVIWTQVSPAPKFLRTNIILPKWGCFLKWSMFW